MNAQGADSIIRSDFDIELDGEKIFGSELISDTLTGNWRNGPYPGHGGTLAESDIISFDFLVAPGATVEVGLDYTLEDFGYGVADGSVTGSGSYFLSLDNIVAIPEPTTLSLLALSGLTLLLWRRQ